MAHPGSPGQRPLNGCVRCWKRLTMSKQRTHHTLPGVERSTSGAWFSQHNIPGGRHCQLWLGRRFYHDWRVSSVSQVETLRAALIRGGGLTGDHRWHHVDVTRQQVLNLVRNVVCSLRQPTTIRHDTYIHPPGPFQTNSPLLSKSYKQKIHAKTQSPMVSNFLINWAFSAWTPLIRHQKSIQPVKIEWWSVGVAICLERGADCLHMLLMPLPSQNSVISCLI